jgi:hypothetical protein
MTGLLAKVSDHVQFLFLLYLSFDRSHAARLHLAWTHNKYHKQQSFSDGL